MKSKNRVSTPTLILALAAWISHLGAAPLITTATNTPAAGTSTTSTTDETIYNSFVSTTDLLHGITGTGGTWNVSNGANPTGLNDGSGAGDSNVTVPIGLTGAAWAANATASFREFFIGNGINGLGYNITEVQSIAAWQGASFQNQKYEILVSTVGSATFTLLATVDFQPASGTSGSVQGGATKINVTDSTAILATGIDAIRFNILDSSGATAGGSVIREIDVFGVPTPAVADTTPPTLNTLTSITPADGATNVPVSNNLTATFSEAIALTGAGSITLRNQSGGADIPIALPGEVSIAGSVLTINPAASLVNLQQYAVEISSGTIRDLATAPNAYAGLLPSDTPNWNFTTAPVDLTNPAVASFNPTDDTTSVPLNANLVVTFDENVVIGTGTIAIKDLDTPAQTLITLPDARVSVAGAVLTINPSTDLAPLTHYAVRINATAIVDTSGNGFPGINDDTTWNFTTQSVPAETFSATQFTYSGNVSATDLLHGLTPMTTGWNTNNNASPLDLTDGIHGVGFDVILTDKVQGAWTTVGATAIYNLGLSPGGAGYDITSVQSIADWAGSGFGNQAWTIEVKPVSGSFTSLATVNYQPLGAATGGCTKVTLTHPSGILASGIEFIKITANSVNGGANSGAFVWRELDVFGVPTNDETAPQIVTLNPTDDSSNAPPSSNITATFSESIALGTGTITIRNLDSPASDTVITLPDPRVTVAGAVLTINPASDLVASTSHAIRIDATAITDISANPFAGIANDTTWNFTTGTPDLTAPTILSLNPADGSTTAPLAANLVATFSENIALGTGTITIKDLETPAQTVITLPDARVSVTGAALTINPTANLSATTDYAVQISSGAVTDIAGNPFNGITNDTTWNFTSASAPLRIMCLGDSITVGYTDNPSWANHPFMFGYRSGLYTRLTNAGYNFKFVGTSAEPWSGTNGDPTYGGTYTPTLDLRTFTQDGHRGYGGASIGGVNGSVAGYIAADTPDVILLLIGINGIGSGSPAALNTLVNTIVTAAPNARLIVAQITPRSSFNQSLYDYNLYIRDTLVPSYVSAGKNVSTVNLYSLFLTNPSDYSSSIAPNVLANGINHPDNPRYDLMAQEWFKGIEALGLGPNTFSRWIAGFPGVGALTGFNDDPDGDGNKNGLENFFGTTPNAFTPGVIAGEKSGDTFTFTHPRNATPAIDVSAAYHWSKDCSVFQPAGSTDLDGTTVSFLATPGVPVPGTTSVTATVTGAPAARLFVRVEVTKN